MRDSDLMELVKDLERRYGCACEIDVKITGKEIKKYGDLGKRRIKLVLVDKIENEQVKCDILGLRGEYKSIHDLRELVAGMQSFNLAYHVKDDGIYLKDSGDSREGAGDKVANIIYERLK